jgi:hypothetical protein
MIKVGDTVRYLGQTKTEIGPFHDTIGTAMIKQDSDNFYVHFDYAYLLVNKKDLVRC